MKPEKKKPETGTAKPVTPTDLMKALAKAGYTLAHEFQRKGHTLTLHLTPTDLIAEDGNFLALETCAALGLQADCRVLAAFPPILILSVELEGEEFVSQGAIMAEPPTESAAQTDKSAIENQKSEINS